MKEIQENLKRKKILHNRFQVDDLRALKEEELPALAEEIREVIISRCLENGGHLAPSLGAVELAVALHYTFRTPRDLLIWDVGHQAYAHKILTGRIADFQNLRQHGGISGFLKREESLYDVFGAGHASTSVAAAAGFAKARDLNGEDYKVITVIGDGAMTGGLAFEGLNLIGAEKLDVLVILNDNDMSIDHNVGGLSKYFNRAITTRFYNRIREDMQRFVKSLPAGDSVYEWLRRLEESMKNMVIKGAFYEDLGFNYIGPVDGNNLKELLSFIRKTKEMKGPVLLHVRTKKGKGYSPAEEDPESFHGISPCRTGKKGKTYTALLQKELLKWGKKEKDLVAVTAAMPAGTGLGVFKEVFPDRYIDVGIAEGSAVIIGAALALAGKKPFVGIYSTFLQRGYDQLIHDVALQDAPVRFLIDRSGLVGEDGPTHHGAFDIAYLRTIPGMTLLAPADDKEFRDMIAFCCRYDEGPVALRYPRGEAVSLPGRNDAPVERGRGLLLRPGRDLMIFALGRMVKEALDAAGLLEERGIDAGVYNLRFAKPLDREAVITYGLRARGVVSLEYGTLSGGIGEEIARIIAEEGGEKLPFLPLGIPDRFIEQGTQQELIRLCGLDSASLAERMTAWFTRG
ncbi:1-deoxy-D-xylulose-5-phosphate synthase [Candidatus Mcinerneyibacteriota bacterium]|nr:1-deoxy-D-xylulose-5-phosphate synthase [Candidatus Mcinerneyibacteriota bacterium]